MRIALSFVAVLFVITVVGASLIGAEGSGASTEEPGICRVDLRRCTLTLASGSRVRLLQIDTPELGSGECYSQAAGPRWSASFR
jgi:hypothetical protein